MSILDKNTWKIRKYAIGLNLILSTNPDKLTWINQSQWEARL